MNRWVRVVLVGLGFDLAVGVGCWVGFRRGWVVPEEMGTSSADGDGYE